VLQWEGQVGSLSAAGQPAPCERTQDVGLHRVRRAACEDGDEESSSDEDRGGSHIAAIASDGLPSDTSSLKISTPITYVVDYIGNLLEQVHSEMNSPRRLHSDNSLAYDDPQRVPQQQVVVPPSRPTRTGSCEGKPDGNAPFASSLLTARSSGSLTARSCSKTARQIEASAARQRGRLKPLSGIARVANEPGSEPEPKSADESEALDHMNPVSEWLSNLIR
jgi:hypothetical protein